MPEIIVDLRAAVQSYVDGLCSELELRPVPRTRLIQNSSPKRSCGDFNIFILQPSFDCLRPHMARLVDEIPLVSADWPLPIERVSYSESSAYLELFLKRGPAFERLFHAIDAFRVDEDGDNSVGTNSVDSNNVDSNNEGDDDDDDAKNSVRTTNTNTISKSGAFHSGVTLPEQPARIMMAVKTTPATAAVFPERIIEDPKDLTDDEVARSESARRLLIVHAPDQSAFDRRRSEMLASYMRTQLEACGIRVYEVKDVVIFENDSALTTDDYLKSEYFDEAKQAFDLRRYLEDRSLEAELDANLGAVYLDSPAVGLARALAGALQAVTLQPSDDVLLCHVAPQNKAYVQQQAGVLLEILNCVGQSKCRKTTQVFVVHGGTDARQSSLDDYLHQINDYVMTSLRQRRLRSDEGSPIRSLVVQALADTKLTFDLLAARQMARLKISPLASAKDYSSEAGVGGGGGAVSSSFDGKGGIFVQYTCARLAVLLANYDQAVADGRYPTCKPWRELRVQDIDLSTLNIEYDWLLWRMMFRCQSVLERGSALHQTLSDEASRGRVIKLDLCAHNVCEALAAACVQFSAYYSKVRVLVESQPHLMESLKARIYLLGSLRSLLHRGLRMLSLRPVQRM